MKSLLCIVSKPPYAGTHTLEVLETAMVGAVFDFKVSLLFRDAGVWNLLPGQDASDIGLRTLSNVLQALPTYEVDRLYVCAQSLQALNIDSAELPVEHAVLSPEEQAALIAEQDAVVGAQS